MRGMATMRWPTSWQATPRLRRRGRANARATGSLGFADFRAGAVLQDRLDRILGRRLAGIAFGPEDGLAVIFEIRSEEHTSELQSLMRISYAVFCLKKKNININTYSIHFTFKLDIKYVTENP